MRWWPWKNRDKDLARELQSDLELEEEEQQEFGLSAEEARFAAGDYRDWRAQSHGFEDMAAMRAYGGIISGVQSELPEVVQSAAGSANLFPLLGVSAVLGRTFTDAEDQPEGQPVVLLTWSIFQRRFAGDPSIIGKQVHLDTKPTTVIGVLPSWFTYPDAKIQFWLPYAQTFSYSPGDYGHADDQCMVVARL